MSDISKIEIKKGDVICTKGESLSQLLVIMNGRVEISFNGYPFCLEKGDVIGLCEIAACSHVCTYTAISDVVLFPYPYNDFCTLEDIISGNPDTAELLVNSMIRQVSDFLRYRGYLKEEDSSAYELVNEAYAQYERLCTAHSLTPKKLPGLPELTRFSLDPIDDWLHKYYMEIGSLNVAVRKGFFYNSTSISIGFLHQSAADTLKIAQACRLYQAYLNDIAEFFIAGSGHDLFSLVSELHFNTLSAGISDNDVELLMAQLTRMLPSMTGIDPGYYRCRLNAYKENLNQCREALASGVDIEQTINDLTVLEAGDLPAAPKQEAAPANLEAAQSLSDSIGIILKYSGCSEEAYAKFIHCTRKYIDLEDKSSSESDVRHLRTELSEIFYEIYELVFIKSLKKPPAPPQAAIIKMFLNFGYVDARLAGYENAEYLYSIAGIIKGDPDNGVYTISEWLESVYTGKKEPSRNEFDLDYKEYLQEMKKMGRITPEDIDGLLNDQEEKLKFEIKNVFPLANKITFGRISTYCPLFSGHNVQRHLDASLIEHGAVKKALDEVCAIDFSAYCREAFYSNPLCGVSNEILHREIRPDFILMPNVGMRGSMWQEIEGRRRDTPGRMFLPIFLEADLKTMVIRMTAEFRWEMCKRIHGVHWNDVAVPSITSGFCDYLQFYKTNRSLSAEAKENIKNELMRAGKNYKNVFISNYTDWILYESNGVPRLNKQVIMMMVSHCPFPADIREKLSKNPRYIDMLNRYNIIQQKRVRHLLNVMQRINRSNKDVPQEILDELGYTKR
ncbi:MAG: cyclic nucleotide-binding domain-containing protein [Oscillospiraceae bacterium]|nr:cyclic nucleotide-binding domain-containing protein [Oscillospiraceae bacterium]